MNKVKHKQAQVERVDTGEKDKKRPSGCVVMFGGVCVITRIKGSQLG